MDVRILIIDDSAALVETLREILRGEGYTVETFRNGELGWRHLQAAVAGEQPMPDLLLLDLMMPQMDGLSVLRRLRSDDRFALLPVIVLTVQADHETRLKALEAGANDFLSKPIEAVELIARVRTILTWKLAERRQQRRMSHLIEAGRVLMATLDMDTVLEQLLKIVITEMNAEGGSIWLVRSDDKLRCRAAFGAGSQRLLGITLENGQGIAGWVMEHEQSLLVPDVQSDPRFNRNVEQRIGFLTRDLVAVPLLVRGSGIGVLEAVNRQGEPFSSSDRAWLEVLAPIAAAALANARLFDTLRQRTIELQERNEELDAFSHTVAHDLQSSLTFILGFAEVLEEGYESVPEAEMQELVQTVIQVGRKMSNIIHELLLLAQVRKTEVEVEPLDMESVVSTAVRRLDYMIRRSDAEVILPDEWPQALGYGPWVEEVWVNYLSNAIKYGGEPPRAELGATVKANGSIRFWLRDNGLGIKPEDQNRLFTPFTRLDQAQAKGQGLGLSIVRRIVEKLGGQVGVHSEVGSGSEFFFTLPAAD